MNEQLIAQWVIDNRYPKSEQEKVSDSEMYNYIVEAIQALTSVKSESAEEYKTQVVIPIQIKHKNYCDLNGKIIPTEFILDKEHFFYGGYGYIVLHDFANNSEAMNDCQITFGNHFKTKFRIVDNRIEILDAINGWGDSVQTTEIKVEYLTNKEK